MGRSHRILQALQEAVEREVFPGAVLLVQAAGAIRHHLAVGQTALAPLGIQTSTDTRYDLASLTKPLAIASGAVLLVQEERLALDAQVSGILDELSGSPVGRVTVRQLLAHRSGLPAWRPFYEQVVTGQKTDEEKPSRVSVAEQLLQAIGKESLICEPGTTRIYSDLGFILLGFILERLTGCTLDVLCQTRIFALLGARSLSYVPCHGQGTIPPDARRSIAPTEYEPWRGYLVHGEVHDNNAYVLGGVAGHAGLFGTARDVAMVAQAWLDAVHARPSFFDPALAREFVGWPDGSARRWALGWDTPAPPSSSGRYFSSRSFGHLGFTGTSVWIDPACELIVVLLSNRVHPTSVNTKISDFRPMIHDLVYEDVCGARKGEP